MSEPTEEELVEWYEAASPTYDPHVLRLIEALRSSRAAMKERTHLMAQFGEEANFLQAQVAALRQENERLREWQRIALNVLEKVRVGYVEDIAGFRSAEQQLGQFIEEARQLLQGTEP